MPVLKLIGSFIVVLATTLLGFQMAAAYRDRPRQLRQLIRALTDLQAQVEHQATPLPTALERAATRASAPSAAMFGDVAHLLRMGGMSVSEAFATALSSLRERSALLPADLEAIQMVADTLSTMDGQHLHTQFQLSTDALRQAETLARDTGLKNARLWQYLGVLTGVILVILLY